MQVTKAKYFTWVSFFGTLLSYYIWFKSIVGLPQAFMHLHHRIQKRVTCLLNPHTRHTVYIYDDWNQNQDLP